MPSCDMCGYEGRLQDAVVEGSMLRVCDRCSTFGKVVHISKPSSNSFSFERQKPRMPSVEEVIVEDYADLIKAAREKRQLTQEELASQIQEKISVIHKLESGQLPPPLLLAKKLEKYLHILLVASYTEKSSSASLNIHDKTLTIGDLIKIKNKS